MWRGNVRYRHYCSTREKLKNTLFYAVPVFAESIPKCNEQLYRVTTSSLLELNEAKPLTIFDYTSQQKDKRATAKKEFEELLVRLTGEVESVHQRVKLSADVPEAEDLDPVKLGQRNKKKSMVEQKREEKERKHKRALARLHSTMCGPFIRLFDYKVVESLVHSVMERVRGFYASMLDRKPQARIFTSTVHYGRDSMVFQPNEEEFRASLEEMISQTIADLGSITRLVAHFRDRLGEKEVTQPNTMGEILAHSAAFNFLRERILKKISDDFVEAEYFVKQTFEKARPVNDYVESWDFSIYKSEGHTVHQIKDELNKLKDWLHKDIQNYVPSQPNTSVKGIINFEGKEIREHLRSSLTAAADDLKNFLNSMALTKADSANDELHVINSRLSQQPANLSDFVKYIEDYKRTEGRISDFEGYKGELDEIEKTLRREKFANDMQTTILKISSLERNCKLCRENIAHADAYIRTRKDDMVKKLTGRVEKLRGVLGSEISKKLDEDGLMLLETPPGDALNDLKKLETKMKKCENNAQRFQHYQQVLDIPVAKVKELQETSQKFQAKMKLWTLRRDWDEFHAILMHKDFLGLGSGIKSDITRFEKEAGNVKRLFMMITKDSKDQVVEDIYGRIKDISEMMPVIENLSIEALKTRHWLEIFGLLEGNVQYVEGSPFSLADILSWGVMKIKDKVDDISGRAAGEFQLEVTLEEIKTKWADSVLVLNNYRESRDRFYITKIEDTFTLLEDHQVSVQTMLGNRYISGVKAAIEEWDKKLRLIQDVIDEWLYCQKQWMYLESIFSAPDIQKQLPRETTKFLSVDRFWRELMLRTHKNPNVVECCVSEGLYDRFVKNNKVLDEIKKSLDEYLESKRLAFPRFYFLADEELLEILSQTRNPYKVQDHLRKCFDSMEKIIFVETEDGLVVTGMVSGEKETVTFTGLVHPVGNVEHWLSEIEHSMRSTLYDRTKEAYQEYPKNGLDRKDWFFAESRPAQVVLTVDQVFWTFNATNAIEDLGRDTAAITNFYEYCKLQIEDMVRIVRGELTVLQRTLMGALIVLGVHGRDVISNLVHNGVNSVWDFEWSKQLRYYWESDVDDCVVRQTNAKFLYGYEYLGNGSRLVITPLTDKCYLTLTGALHLFYGGAPQGPAGTGKTESTKDLGKALAIQCVVFNCSDGLDVNIMARFFSGLAQAGAWSCFDEFNRIDIEVLSVIAQQILTIQQAIRNDLDEFEFFGRMLKLNKRFGVFITMNPGYAGRTELPDNLKALFRPVAMMIPDYAMIAEIVLFSEGFEGARGLARKMVQLYKLASEQLSKQDHYDFGMRAVKSVLVMAGQLRRRNPELDEDVVLIRAMRDSNVPKFLEADLPLFRGIISDLFPTVLVPDVDYGDLERAIREQLRSHNYKEPPNFIIKIIQLFETMLVRHGNMIVGPAATGKTTLYKTLADALTQLYQEELEDETRTKDDSHQKVVLYPLNPKAISMGELYGQTSITGDFTDGIVPILVREAKADDTPAKKWVVFDGPVDSLWIESMNTVLDDNKMLCLTSGERIKLPDTITMLFEVQDLAQASPATVSRCGMVYIDPVHLGWEPLIDSWAVKFRAQFASHAEHAVSTVRGLIENVLPFLRAHCREEIPSMNANLVTSCLTILQALLREDTFPKKRPEEAVVLVNLYIIFAVTWSFGANLDDASRVTFDQHFREEIDKIYPHFPLSETIYDYCIDEDMCEFISWENKVLTFNYNSRIPYFSILVPTVDTVRYKYILEVLLQQSKHVMFMGSTGVGKTVIIQDYMSQLSPEHYVSYVVNCSAQTSSRNVYNIFEDKLTKPKKKLRRPPIGKKMLMFVDDINMPALDRYGSQPPVELFRQVIESGYYDLKNFFYKKVEDVIFVAACAPPGGGRNSVTPRLLRHFNMIWQTQLSQQSMEVIFSSILRGFLDEHPEANFSDYAEPIVKGSVEMYLKICNDLLPTPSKSHYTFNLRDLSKVIQGILMVSYEHLTELNTLVLLWMHESSRVFRDRLVSDKDRAWFNDELERKTKHHLSIEVQRSLWVDAIFGDLMSGPLREYTQVLYDDKLFDRLQVSLETYNSENTNRMNLVFFKDAVNHLARVARILRQPRGNALLVGVGGSGRQSLARLATTMAGMRPFSIEITRSYGPTAFHDDLKLLLKTAGAQNESMAFIFSDTQIVKESFLEDINNVLNTGEIPNLYEIADYEEIVGIVRPLAKEAGKPDINDIIFQHYIQLCRDNLHIILAFSPVGEQFRVRLRQFPSIINCCTIDWYDPWPEEALYSVAQRFFDDYDHLGIKDSKAQLCKICVEMHTQVKNKSDLYEKEMRRKNYTTPTSYLELIKLYLAMLTEQQKKVPEKIKKYDTGLERLDYTNRTVGELQIEQVKLQKTLEEATVENLQLMEELKTKQADAKIKEDACTKDEAECTVTMKEVAEIKDECQKELDEALPALEAANRALERLDKASITEMKSYTKPHPAVENVMNAVCLLFKEKQNWDTGKKLLSDFNFLMNCMKFDKDKIPAQTLRKLQNYVNDPNFNKEFIEGKSIAAASLCEWVCAMDKYAKVVKNVAPKRARLQNAEENLKNAQEFLFSKQAALKEVQDEVGELEATFQASVRKAEDLKRRSDQTVARLGRAEKLVSGLKNESKRWKESTELLRGDLNNLIGNIMICAGFVAYFGPFTMPYRQSLAEDLIKFSQSLKVPVDPEFSLERILADPIEVREWNLAGLPADQLSIDNAIIVNNSRRWPLIIDPQGQANTWIKNMDRETIKVIKLSEWNFLKTLETGIRFGNPILLENLEETLDPSLDPILQKQVVKKAGQLVLRLGDTDVPYSNDFRFYMTSKLSNPHYLPEICIKVTVINFTVTLQGLEDQLLVDVVKAERPELEELKNKLIVQISSDKDMLQELEDKILTMVSRESGDILDDEELIETLDASKERSEVVHLRMAEAEKTANDINVTREKYRVVAVRGSILYFVIADIGLVDSMYQYSLDFFSKLFNQRLRRAEKSEDLNERLNILINDITRLFYLNICRGLFEKDKLMYSFLNAVRLSMNAGGVLAAEWAMFLSGPKALGEPVETPHFIIEGGCWASLKDLETLHSNFTGLTQSLLSDSESWKAVFCTDNPFTERLPSPFEGSLSNFQKLIVGSMIKQEKLVSGIKKYVKAELGEFYIESPPFDLNGAFSDSVCTAPIIFVLSPGADPIADLLKLATDNDMDGRFRILSLGQGQGKLAQKYIDNGRRNGDWVCLQNCHLAASWMGDLERIQEQQVESDIHPEYRLWLTSMPTTAFPVPVLQSGIKLTNEPPKGLKANLGRTFQDVKEDEFTSCKMGKEYKKLLFSLAFFHAVILERRKFGAIGWNIPYEWMTSDFITSKTQLFMYLNEQATVPYGTLKVLVAEINYGGRVTDDKDVRLITALLDSYFTPEVMDPDYRYSSSDLYKAPDVETLEDLFNYIRTLPLEENPEVFGLHSNANITFNTKTVHEFYGALTLIYPTVSGGTSNKGPDQIVTEMAADIEKELPRPMRPEIQAHEETFATNEQGATNSLGVFIGQEISRFNELLQVMRHSLIQLQKAIRGDVVMGQDLERMYNSFLVQKIPENWLQVAYPSLKPLAAWVADLFKRVQVIHTWLTEGPLPTFCLSAFFFPQGFMTSVMQMYARETKTAIDTLKFKTIVSASHSTEITERRANGVNIHGLYLQGAKWSWENKRLEESAPGVLFDEMPVIGLELVSIDTPVDGAVYNVPLYKTSSRAGELSTTGHSTNFVLFLELPTTVQPLHWVRRGVALLCQLDD